MESQANLSRNSKGGSNVGDVNYARPLTRPSDVSSDVGDAMSETASQRLTSPSDLEAPSARELWDRHGEAVCRFAAMVARTDAEAEDIAQESLIRAIRALPRWTPSGAGIEGWLWRIVQNTARDFGRAARRRQLLIERITLLLDRSGQVWPDVDEPIETWDLIRAIRTLPAHHRMLIALRFGADLEYTAVGRELGLSPVAARAATRRALSALKRELQGVGPKR